MCDVVGRDVVGGRFVCTGIVVVLVALCLAGPAHAGTGGTEFADVWTKLLGWIQGTLGLIISASMIVIGLVMGIARQSLMAFVVGIASGLGLYETPTVMAAIYTGTLPVAADLHALPVVDLLRAAALV